MSSDKKKVAKKKRGNVMSSVLVVAAVAAAGGTGYFLWNYQARLDKETPAPVAAAVGEPLPDPVEPKQPEAWVTELLPTTSHPAPAPKSSKPVRGDIKIVGRNGTTASVAPPTAEDVAANSRDSSSYNYPRVYTSPGPTVYTPRDPNRDLPPAPYRSGRPRYYDFESNRSHVDDNDPTFQRRTTVK